MKSIHTIAQLMGFIVIVLVSCKKAEQLQTSEEVSRKNIVIVTGGAPIELPDCWSTCISPEGPYIEASGAKSHSWGNAQHPNWKVINYVAYNTSNSFAVKVTFTQSEGNRSNKISVNAFGSAQSIPSLASGATATFSFALPAGWHTCDPVPFSISQEGQSASVNISSTYNLYSVCE